jgi:hypothetical protein
VFRHSPVDDQGDRVRQEAHGSYDIHLELQPKERRPSDRSAEYGNKFLVIVG